MSSTTLSYSEWIKEVQTSRNSEWKFNVTFSKAKDVPSPPLFEHVSLFHEGAEQYAMDMTSVPSKNVQEIAQKTMEQGLFAPCMVGTLESQFLKMQVSLAKARTCLDVGTFTGMSAMAMAEGTSDNGHVVTLEFDDKIADVAEASFKTSPVGHKIQLVRGSALSSMEKMLANGDTFDVIFLDADKENYINYYNLAMSGLLSENGFILADNSLCSLLYDSDDARSQKLHEFNQHVKNDERVEQIVLTMREGVTIIKPLK
ncbi:hypothetical protein TCAL_10626 [Tigriopus californicus]|uniref:O-methyltransferase domain-containing protein n=1 Tax=Tigriopus californicus TaxID=6832 RepID=A0A553PGY0_TIGCA|nr:O-methyltransferase MdmC-like [Tigriopus californicus]TRY76935.1 hypothetical protein TCAL_10626 [Tigriopus californicus]|eukprot:TCALIF_10626-PA protein Name:"Similar to mdmC O-methyltransferase MdmC (Streptomyces mycarofaciens)" AED:0.07 eAED:0.07 QI:0/-1/0/1/-1/1/1/0/257